MFGFLKSAFGMIGTYRTGKALEQSYRLAGFTTMMYVLRLWDVERNPSARDFAMNVWSYLLFTEPADTELLAFRSQHKDEIERESLRLLDEDEPFRTVVAYSMWVGLCVCKSQNDKAGAERILGSETFKKYYAIYPMLPHNKYAQVVEDWMRMYSPLPPPATSV